MGPAGQPGEKRTARARPVLAAGLIAGPSWAGAGKKGAGRVLGWVWFSISFSFLFPFLFFQTNSN